MYDLARRRLAEAGFDHYEVSNWARPGEECRHNLVYWTLGDWVAVGPAAAGNLGDTRYRNRPRLDDWLESTGTRGWSTSSVRPRRSRAGSGSCSVSGCGRAFRGRRSRRVSPRIRDEPRSSTNCSVGATWSGMARRHRIPESRIMTSDGILGRLV